MDREQARFLLRSFRPCGADGSDADFAEALKLANEDLELGQWLASERAFDAEFAVALARLSMPESLRESILVHLAIERGDLPQVTDRFEAMLVGGVATIQPPAELRTEILMAMSKTAGGRRSRRVYWRRAMIPLAAAAGIAVAFVASSKPAGQTVVEIPKLPMELVETEFIRAFESPDFTLDEKREDHQVLMKHLRERKLPCPCCLPKGLAEMKSIGCRELVIDGRVGSIICFNERKNGVVHLVVFRREDVDSDLPGRDTPSLTQHGKWAMARWEDHERVFILIGDHTNPQQLSSLF
ncbi:MAG: hypothetical protein K9N23_19995 [Akkermansiaceae bacterium]|nr:hypothetical protein [Akkermansiaceae bacterium]